MSEKAKLDVYITQSDIHIGEQNQYIETYDFLMVERDKYIIYLTIHYPNHVVNNGVMIIIEYFMYYFEELSETTPMKYHYCLLDILNKQFAKYYYEYKNLTGGNEKTISEVINKII